jgi:hypothetical protein
MKIAQVKKGEVRGQRDEETGTSAGDTPLGAGGERGEEDEETKREKSSSESGVVS